MNIIKTHITTLKFIAIVALIFVNNLVFCQTSKETDSLVKIVKSNKADTLKIEALSNLFFIYEFSDTTKSKLFLEQELRLSEKNRDTKWLASTYVHFAFFNEDKSDLNKAIEFHQKALSLYKENTSLNKKEKSKNLSACYNNIALIYGKLGIYNKAIDYYLLSLKIDEVLKDSAGISISYSNIGIIHRKQDNYDKALEYYFKSLRIAEKLNNKGQMSSCYNNIGLAYQYKKDYKQAISFILKSLQIDEKFKDLNRMSSCYNNLGNVYFDLCEYEKCILYYKKSLNIRYQLGDKNGQSSVLGNIAALNTKLKQYDQAIINAKKSASIAKEIGVLPWQMSAYEVLSKTYDSLANYKNAYEYHKLFKLLNDSIYTVEGSKQIKGMEAKYESEKKQKEIELLNKDKQLQQNEIKQQIIIKYAFVIGFLLMILLAGVIYKNFRNKKKANVLLHQQNNEISQQKEEISTQRDEIEAQRDLVTEQKEWIEEIHKEVTDSINYAKRIQEAVLPVSNTARAVLGEHFILFKPKDIVSGDFYWTNKINNLLIVTVADCTGHGVPGAFMSMLGISFLNEIVRKQEVTQANHVLIELRKEIINALQQKGQQGEQTDGMDISLFVINTDTNECQWAGANNPLYIISSVILNYSEEQFSCEAKSKMIDASTPLSMTTRLIELKGDKMPIAIYPKMKDFTNHEFILQKGDLVYLFTDGFADQFGGKNGRKFMYKHFKELLLSNYNKSLAEQGQILEKTLEKWKEGYEQTDDITVFGIKI